MSSPDTFFDEVRAAQPELPVHRTDLQHHAAGCYATHLALKSANRRAEQRLADAEQFSALAASLVRPVDDRPALQSAWENVLFNQFHDITGGCSIREAYDDAQELHGESLAIAGRVLNHALQRISWAIDTEGAAPSRRSKEQNWITWEDGERGAPLVVFNGLSWDVTRPVETSQRTHSVTDETGTPLPVQQVRASRTNGDDCHDGLFMADVPALGYRVFRTFRDTVLPAVPPSTAVSISPAAIGTDRIRLEFDPATGCMTGLSDVRSGAQYLSGPGAALVLIDEEHCDTWAHNVYEFHKEAGRFGNATTEVLEEGPLRVRLRVESACHHSRVRQDFIVYAGSDTVEVRMHIDWREKHRMLKLSFPVAVDEATVTAGIPYGALRREPDGDEMPAQRWVDVSGVAPGGVSRGITLTSDSTYGYDAAGSDLRLTLLRSPIYADHFGKRDSQVEYMEQGEHRVRYWLRPHTDSVDTALATRQASEWCAPPLQLPETFHKGPLPERYRGVTVSTDNVNASVLKRSEDDSGYVVRCHECGGRAATADIGVPCLSRQWQTTFGPYQIRTFLLPDDRALPVAETNLLEMSA